MEKSTEKEVNFTQHLNIICLIYIKPDTKFEIDPSIGSQDDCNEQTDKLIPIYHSLVE